MLELEKTNAAKEKTDKDKNKDPMTITIDNIGDVDKLPNREAYKVTIKNLHNNIEQEYKRNIVNNSHISGELKKKLIIQKRFFYIKFYNLQMILITAQ